MNSPFVRTPHGVGIVEVSAVGGDPANYVRFENGERRWVSNNDCKQIEAPEGYEAPALSDIPGAAAWA